jgi:integrase
MANDKKPTGGNRARGTKSGVFSQKRKDGGLRWYGDFRTYVDVGGKCERLIDPATGKDAETRIRAQELYAQRCAHLQKVLDSRASNVLTHLGPMIQYHLIKRAEMGKVKDSTIATDQDNLNRIYEAWGNCALSSINTAKLEAYVAVRLMTPSKRKGKLLSPNTVLNELHSLSTLLRRARSLGLIDQVATLEMVDKPARPAEEAHFLERRDASALLDAAHELDVEVRAALAARALTEQAEASADRSTRHALLEKRDGLLLAAGLCYIHKIYDPIHEALIATFLYTGARHGEVLGLRIEDIDFEKGVVHLEENAHRGLKRRHHARSVLLWPGLRAILTRYIAETGRTHGLLFPGATSTVGELRMRHSF